MGHRLFEVPIIHQDLRHEEAIVQIADALEYLNHVVHDVFVRIDARIEENKIKLNSLRDRAAVTRMKVEKLTGSNKATKVFSSAKYPAVEVHSDYKSSFSSNMSTPLLIDHYPEKIKSKHSPSEDGVLQEKLQFYHVKVSSNLLRKNVEITPEEGLGRLPQDLDSIGSLLLFNTSENPYKRYVMLDPLGAISKTRHPLEEKDNEMEAAPISISQHEQLQRQAGDSFFYSPGLGEVPQIDVPLDLPDLPGVADDLRYIMDSGPTIAPSVSTTPAIPELPTLVPETPTSPPEPVEMPVSKPPPSPVAPPPPPPAPPVMLPPPPPPPPPPVEPIPLIVTPPKGEAPPLTVNDGNARANLMEAIRQAGGSGRALLKSAEEKKIEAKKKKQEEKATGVASSGSGGDLMADLHAKLSMRRKGISGVIKSNETSAMDRIRDMIPPPRLDEVKIPNAEEEADWE